MTEDVTIKEIRSIQKYMHDNKRKSDSNVLNYLDLDGCINDLINVINKISRENDKLQPTILEKAIMNFIESRHNRQASLEAIVNECVPYGNDFLTIHFVTATIDKLKNDGTLKLVWFDGDESYTYRVISR